MRRCATCSALRGAIVADLMMQLFGIASVALVLPIAVWGWRLASHRALHRERLRLLAWVAAVVLTASFAACLPRTAAWPLPAGLGGVTGDALLRFAVWVAGNDVLGLARLIVGVAAGVGASVALALTLGFGWQRGSRGRSAAQEPAQGQGRGGRGRRRREEEEDAAAPPLDLARLAHARLPQPQGAAGALARAPHHPAHHVPRAVAGPRGRTGRAALRRLPDRAARARDGGRAGHRPDEDEEETRARPRKPQRRPRRSRSAAAAISCRRSICWRRRRRKERTTLSNDIIQANATALEGVLGDFGVRGEIINARPGPVVTLYELEPAPGIKSSRVIGLSDDIARSMSALSARVAVVSGRNAIGIELPNPTREKVYLRELLAADDYNETSAKLPLCLGKTIGGEPVIVDLTRMPHLLIAGTTGSGKSVAINTMILSLLYRLTPDQCRLIMVDPKMLELSVYDAIPHLLTPVVTDPKKAIVALKWAVREMEERYKKMSKLGVRNIDGYNARVVEAEGEGREALAHRPHRLRQGIRRGDLRGRGARPRAAALSSSSSSTRWPT